MSAQVDFRHTAYAMTAAGVVLAFAAAVVPHYAAGYRLLVDVLLIGLLPYLVYLVFSELVRGRLLPWVGIALFAADLAVKLPARYLHAAGSIKRPARAVSHPLRLPPKRSSSGLPAGGLSDATSLPPPLPPPKSASTLARAARALSESGGT
jgi:hypothetical protein